jgi:hypothetical protein
MKAHLAALAVLFTLAVYIALTLAHPLAVIAMEVR